MSGFTDTVLEGVGGALGAAQTCAARARALSEQLRSDLVLLARWMEETPTRSDTAAGAAVVRGGGVDVPAGSPYDTEVSIHREWVSQVAERCDRSQVMAAAVLEELDEAVRHVRRARGGLMDGEIGQPAAGDMVAVLTARTEALQEVVEAARPIAQAASNDLADARALAQRQSEMAGLGVLPRPGALDKDVVRAGQDARHLSTVADAVELSADRSVREATRTIELVAHRRLRADGQRDVHAAPATTVPAATARGR